MDQIVTALTNSLPVFVTIVVTLLLKATGTFNDKMREGIKPMLFKFILPVFAFNVLYGLTLDISKLNLVGYAIIFDLILLAGILGLNLIFRFGRETLGTLLIIMLTFGVGSFAYPFIQLNFTEAVFEEVVIIDITLFVIVLIFGPLIGNVFSKRSSKSFISIVKSIVTDPVLISVALSLSLTALGVRLPDSIKNTLDFISKGFIFVVLVYLALSLKTPNIKEIFNLGGFIFYRIIIAIAFVFVLMKLSGSTIDVLKALPLTFITPFSSFGLIYSEQFGLNSSKAAQLVIFSIIVLIFFYPFVIAFLL